MEVIQLGDKKRYYVYDFYCHEFITVDDEMATISAEFVRELESINISYLKFVRTDEYEKNKGLLE